MRDASEKPGGIGSSERTDVSLPVTLGVAYANFAEAVEKHGGDPGVLREHSLSSLEEALSVRGDLWRVQVKEAEVLEKLGRFERAAELYREALSRARWDSNLKRKYFRAKVRAALSAGDPGPRVETSTPIERIQERPTRIVSRKPKSARIRKYYRLGLIQPGA
jgi:tetratricopeptide (TPR) repeat protein